VKSALPGRVHAPSVESGFGRTADQFSSAGAYGYGQFLERTWRSYGGGVPWRTVDPYEIAKPTSERQDSTNFHHALPAMARYLCAEGGGRDLRKAIFAYNHADSYVAEVVQLATRYGGIGASGSGLIAGWIDRPPLNQYDRRHYRSDQSCLSSEAVPGSIAAPRSHTERFGHAFGTPSERQVPRLSVAALCGSRTPHRRCRVSGYRSNCQRLQLTPDRMSCTLLRCGPRRNRIPISVYRLVTVRPTRLFSQVPRDLDAVVILASTIPSSVVI
jgi:hypothetical protein